MSKYVWAWADGEGNYVNEAESLSDIVHEVLEYYSCDYQSLKIIDGHEIFFIQIATEKEIGQYDVKVNPGALTEFLNQQAELVGRPDKFDIKTMTN